MYCRYCGKEIPSNSIFCPNCGKKQVEGISMKDSQIIQHILGKYKKVLFFYLVWCLIHIGLFLSADSKGEYSVFIKDNPIDPFSNKGHSELVTYDHSGAFYPFDTSLSNVLQWKSFWCDPIKNVDVYDASELFFYTLLLPFLIWGLIRIWPNMASFVKKKYAKYTLLSKRKRCQKPMVDTATVSNIYSKRGKFSARRIIILKVFAVIVCFVLLGIKMCTNNPQEIKEGSPIDTDSIEEVDSVADEYEEYYNDYVQKTPQAAPVDMDSIVDVDEVDDCELDNADNELFRRLNTGDTPYSDYYGKNMICRKIECSGIKVTAPESSDVVVIVKARNERGVVVGHAYIRAGDTYKINLSGGTYQTFFYYGDEWSPNKDMGHGVKGGFIKDEVFSKDNPQDIYSAVLSYVLQLRRDGNFHTKSSNRSEMF